MRRRSTAKAPAGRRQDGDRRRTDGPAEGAATCRRPAYEAALPEGVRAHLFEPFTGDFDQMAKRRIIRVGRHLQSHVLLRGQRRAARRGLRDGAGASRTQLNKKLKTTNATKVSVVFVPLPRDLLAAALTEGKVDCVVAQVIVRPELQAIVDFTNPTRTNVSEVVVTGPGAPAIASVDDLSGKDVYARKDSSAWQSLVALNDDAEGEGPAAGRRSGKSRGTSRTTTCSRWSTPGLIPIGGRPRLPGGVLEEGLHEPHGPRHGDACAPAPASRWPIRKNSPLLAAELNAFLAKNGLGTAFGNMIEKRYLVSTTFAKQATSEAERKKFLELAALFRKYGEQYQLDYLLMAAQGYQESGLDQNAKSRVGADRRHAGHAGHRQGAEGRRHHARSSANIHAGVKYMRFMIDQYFKDEPMDDAEQGPVRLRLLQRGAGPGPPAAQGGGEARARPQRLVRQRGADRVRAHRAGDGHLRVQHLQVLHRLQAGRRGACAAGRGEEGGQVAGQVMHRARQLRSGRWPRRRTRSAAGFPGRSRTGRRSGRHPRRSAASACSESVRGGRSLSRESI